MKQKKKKKSNNDKFNFDDEYIIGFSDSAKVTKASKDDKKDKKSSKKKNGKKSSTNDFAHKKMNSKKREGNSKVLKIFLILVLFVGAGCFLCISPTFNAKKIVVEKNSIVPAEKIISESGIKMHKNILLINKHEAIENIEKNPYIESVKIKRVYPDQVKIIVKERTEKYLIEFAEGKYAVIDGQGYVLETTNELKKLPILVGTKTDVNKIINPQNNKVRLSKEDLEKLELVSSIMEISKNYEVDQYITKIDIENINEVKLELKTENKIAYLGSCNDLNTRILYMKDIIEKEKGKKGEIFINVNLSEDKVFFREAVN